MPVTVLYWRLNSLWCQGYFRRKEERGSAVELVDSSAPLEACAVEGSAQTGNHDAMFGRAGVDKFVSTDVDTNMVDIASAPTRGIKKDQVACSQVSSADILPVIGLLSGDSWESDAFALANDILGKSRAVEAIGPLCSPYISGSQISFGCLDNARISSPATAFSAKYRQSTSRASVSAGFCP